MNKLNDFELHWLRVWLKADRKVYIWRSHSGLRVSLKRGKKTAYAVRNRSIAQNYINQHKTNKIMDVQVIAQIKLECLRIAAGQVGLDMTVDTAELVKRAETLSNFVLGNSTTALLS